MRYILLLSIYTIIFSSCESVKRTANKNLGNELEHYTFNDKLELLKQGKKVNIDKFSISYQDNLIQDSVSKHLPSSIEIKNLQYIVSIENSSNSKQNINYDLSISGVSLNIGKSILKGIINVSVVDANVIEGFAQNKYNINDKIKFYLPNYDNRSTPQQPGEIVSENFRILIKPLIINKFSILASNSTKRKLEGYEIGYDNNPICFIDMIKGEVWLSSFNVKEDVKAFLLAFSAAILLRK